MLRKLKHPSTESYLTTARGQHLIQSNSTNDNYKMFSEKYLGRNFGWHRPNYKMLLGKFMLAFPILSYFSTSDALVFV